MRAAAATSRTRVVLLSLAALVAASPAAAQAPAWKLGLNASGTWANNVRLARPTAAAINTRLALKLSRDFQAPRWQLGVSGSGAQSFFHGGATSPGNKFNYSAGVQFGWQLSNRAALSVQDSFRSGYSGDVIDMLGLDDAEEVLLPHSGQKRNNLRGSLAFQVSSLTSLSLSGGYYTALFQQDDPLEPRLRNGDRFASGLGLSRKLNDESALNLGYSFALSDQRVSNSQIHGVSMGFSRILGEFTSSGLSIGGSRRTAGGETTYAMTGGAAIARQLENSSISLRYGRNLGPLFGLGRDVLHDTVRLSAQRMLTRSLGLAAGGGYSRNRDPLDEGFSYDAWFGSIGLNLNLFRVLHLHGGYYYALRSPLPGELGRRFEAHRASFQVAWNTAF